MDEVGLKPRSSLVTPEALSFLKTFLVNDALQSSAIGDRLKSVSENGKLVCLFQAPAFDTATEHFGFD